MVHVSNRFLAKWHRKVGIVIALLAFILSATGLLLQHADFLALDRYYIRNATLLNWYHYPTPECSSIRLQHHTVMQIDQLLLWNEHTLGDSEGKMWGAALAKETALIGAGDQLYWVTHDGELIDRVSSPIVNPTALSTSGDRFVIHSTMSSLIANEELFHWEHFESSAVRPTEVTQENFSSLELPNTAPVGITLERLLLDLHSGRLLGPIGILMMDIAAAGLILLAVSGAWLWLRKR